MIEIKVGPKHKVPIQRITLAQMEDKKEKGKRNCVICDERWQPRQPGL